MKKVKLKINFGSYYNKRKKTFDGGLYTILEYIKNNKLKNAIVRLDVDKKNEISWDEESVFAPNYL